MKPHFTTVLEADQPEFVARGLIGVASHAILPCDSIRQGGQRHDKRDEVSALPPN